jgi:ankyrin repeat protein
MPPPELPFELLLTIAHHIRDDYGELHYGDFNSFLQVNRALHACLNRILWKEAGENEVGTQRVLTHLIKTNNRLGLEFFLLELGADVEVRLPAFDMTCLDCDVGALVNSELRLEPTPLLLAADLDNVPLARLLLSKSANVQYFDQYGDGKFSPLHAARSAEMVQLLLDHRANPDLDDEHERRPLHWYAIRNDIAAMRAILQRGAEVDPFGPFEKPLHEAAQRNLDTVKLLVEHGADVRARDLQQDTPLHLAAAVPGKTDVVKFLVERWPEATREKNGSQNTPLHGAATVGNTEVVGLLVEAWPGAIREKNEDGDTPLHLAALMLAEIEVVRLLVERWPEGKEALNDDGKTPLQLLRFEEDPSHTGKLQLSDEEKEEMIALLSS